MTTVALDFGTSKTVLCIVDSHAKIPRTLMVMPSSVFVSSNTKIFGESAKSQHTQDGQLFQYFKRSLWAGYQHLSHSINNQTYSDKEISELFIQHIWRQLQQLNELQTHPKKVIFTVPIGAFEGYLNWLRDFAEQIGIPNVQLLEEPTAVALGYAVKYLGLPVMAVNFGGGSLELSLVRINVAKRNQKGMRAEVLAKSSVLVGGIDIDAWIAEYYLQQIGYDRTEIGDKNWQKLLEVAEQLKIQLSKVNEASKSWFDDENNKVYELQLTRDQLEEILESRQLLEQVGQALDEVLSIAHDKGISKNEIEQVLLVGGSCEISSVKQLIISYFGRQRVKLDKRLEVVAHGTLALEQLLSVDDYLRHGYAIRVWEPFAKVYSYFTLFEKGMKYPCQRPEPLTLQVATEGQREIRLDIGELTEVSELEITYDAQNRMKSRQLKKQSKYGPLKSHNQQACLARLDPSGEIGVDRLEVYFEVDERRILLATVKDLLTGQVLVNRGSVAKLY